MIHCEEAEFAKYDLMQLGATLTAPNNEKQAQAIDDAIQVNHLLALSLRLRVKRQSGPIFCRRAFARALAR